MTEKGEVQRNIVITVLRSNGVTVTPTAEDGSYILQKGDVIESQTFPLYVGRKGLQYLQRHFNVPIHLFFNVEVILKPAIQPKSA
jgi:hypothetical protein